LAADVRIRHEEIEANLYHNAMEKTLEDYDRTNARYIRRRRSRDRFVYRRLAIAAALLIAAALFVFAITHYFA
jgi:fatty acid desaturase